MFLVLLRVILLLGSILSSQLATSQDCIPARNHQSSEIGDYVLQQNLNLDDSS